MHILFLTHYYPPEVNAPASRTSEHCRRWVEAGHDVTVITCAPNCPSGVVFEGYRNAWRAEEMVDGVRVIRVWTYLAPNKGFLRRVTNYLTYAVRAVWESRRVKDVDLVVATSPQLFCGWGGVFARRGSKTPFVLEIRDLWPESIVAVGAMKRSPIIKLLEWLEKKLYQSADHIVTVGNDYRAGIIERGVDAKKISVVPNGVDLSRFVRVDGSELRDQYQSGSRFVCAYVGTVGMAHGLEVVLSAAEKLKAEKRDDIQFWIVGDGARREELEAMARERQLTNVVFTGMLPKERMAEVMSAADAALVHLRGADLFSTVMPSKVFEYMAMDIPIIMGVRGQAGEVVEEARAGVPMTPDDPNSLLECIAEIQRRGKQAFSGRNYVAKFFNRDRLAGEMLEILEAQVPGGTSQTPLRKAA
ncbi:MAG: glycosyltransferase family 4 protein [Planctomycetales bacterium]